MEVFDQCALALERPPGAQGVGAAGELGEPELQSAGPMLAAQVRLSRLPRPGWLLVERLRSSEGDHLFLYPFAGRLVHGGLAQLLAWRLSRHRADGNTFSLSINDHGLEILASRELPPTAELKDLLLKPIGAAEDLLPEVMDSLRAGELPRRRFREIARVSGLVFDGLPGSRKSMRQIQASSSLFYDVFSRYDPGNRLLRQADEEVLSQELDLQRLQGALRRLQQWAWEVVEPASVTPMCLPLMVERLREQLSTEKLSARLERMLAQAEGSGVEARRS